MYQTLSDKSCSGKKCRLKLGASTNFKIKSNARRRGLKYFGFNYLEKTFDSENERKILKKIDKETKESYGDVRERKTLLTSPPHYVYKKLGEFSVMEDEIENNVRKQKYKSANELKDILEFRKIYRPQAGERDVFNPLIGSFFHEPGIFVNGFEQNQYLKEFSQAAEDMRNDIHVREANAIVQSLISCIRKHFPETRSKYVDEIKGEKIMEELECIRQNGTISETALAKARKQFKDYKGYTEEDVEKTLQSALKSCSSFDLTNKSYKFNDLEIKLLAVNGTSEEKIEKLIDRMLERIPEQTLNSRAEGKDIAESIKRANFRDTDYYGKSSLIVRVMGSFFNTKEKDDKKKTKSVKRRIQSTHAVAREHMPKSFTIGNVRNSLKLMLYEDFVKPSGEWDFFIILSRLKVIINVEVKTQNDSEERKETKKQEETINSKKALNGSLESASNQCKEHAAYTARVFAPFLGESWEFVKVAAVLPGDLDRESICDHCDQFIITGENDEEIQKKVDNIKALLVNKSSNNDENEDREVLETLTKLLLGLSSLSTVHPTMGSAWRLVQGADADHKSLSAGWTKSDQEMTLDDLTFINVLNQPNNYNKLVYYNVGQQHILANNLPLVILMGDFGSGNKTLTLHLHLALYLHIS